MDTYEFGRPLSTYLSPLEIIRVTIYRSRLYDSCCQHVSFAARSEERMDVEMCTNCRPAS
jgi:hypothetical protein